MSKACVFLLTDHCRHPTVNGGQEFYWSCAIDFFFFLRPIPFYNSLLPPNLAEASDGKSVFSICSACLFCFLFFCFFPFSPTLYKATLATLAYKIFYDCTPPSMGHILSKKTAPIHHLRTTNMIISASI